jgi:hypothetical protein
MDTPDKADEVKKPGRPKKVDPATPMGEYIADQAKKARAKSKRDPVVEKYYELHGHKLCLCKKVASGTVHKTFVGSVNDKTYGQQTRSFIEKLKLENRIRVKI